MSGKYLVFYNILQSSAPKKSEIRNEILSEGDSINLTFCSAILVYILISNVSHANFESTHNRR